LKVKETIKNYKKLNCLFASQCEQTVLVIVTE